MFDEASRAGQIMIQFGRVRPDTSNVARRSRTALSDGVRLACLDAVNRSLARTTLAGIPASILLAMILGDSVPLPRRIAIAVAIGMADILVFAHAVIYLRRRKRGEVIPSYLPGIIGAAVLGFAWGLPALIALPDSDHVAIRAVYLLFACGTSATNVVGAAARRSYFYATQLAMLTPISIVFIGSSDQLTTLLGYAVPIYFLVMVSSHHDVHSIVISELQLRERNELATNQLVLANNALTERTLRDDLTGFANRTAFMDHLDRAVRGARRDSSRIGILYFDLDRFKVVNDSLGHGAGDELLIQVANRVAEVLRAKDVLARLGGDEFTVFLDRLGDGYEALIIARRVADVFVEPFNISGRSVVVTASIGVATNLHSNDDGETLLAHADAAQYRAKESGRNRVEVFDIDFRDSIERRLDEEQTLRAAIEAGEIHAWFQPQVDTRTGAIIGAEALARWIHPTRGVLGAPHFIPLAEESGLIFALDGNIIQQTVAARVELAEMGIPDSFRLWCNVSARQLTRGEPADQLAALLRRSGCNPRWIGIEITETAVLPDMDAAQRQIQIARGLGVECALDDFGTGHSSLTLLRTLSIDKVKIDRSFVADLGVDAHDTAIVRNVTTLAADLGLSVVAEGVETPEQAQILSAMGCTMAQGFLWSPAVSFTELCDQLGIHRSRAADAPTTIAA